MTPKELQAHKKAKKLLEVRLTFKQLKKGRLPKPFNKMGGPRLHATDLVGLSDSHCAVFLWRDGAILSDTAFFGYLMCHLSDGSLYPLIEFHWHPGHKGFHVKLPCKTDFDYTNRMLPGAPELRVSTNATLDPRNEDHRLRLIDEFCATCGISIVPPNDPVTLPLWN